MSEIELGITADMHVHLRDGPMCELITPTVRQGGIAISYVMPNLVPPLLLNNKLLIIMPNFLNYHQKQLS